MPDINFNNGVTDEELRRTLETTGLFPKKKLDEMFKDDEEVSKRDETDFNLIFDSDLKEISH